MKVIGTVFFVFISWAASAQLFGDRCVGTWKGNMKIYGRGVLRDSVDVTLTVEKRDTPSQWKWKMEYHSPKMPMTKDYILKVKDAEKGIYVTDEQDGIELMDYLSGNKLYSMFETHNVYLTSSYELINDRLIFEVTSGKKIEGTQAEVINYSVDNVQRVVLKRNK